MIEISCPWCEALLLVPFPTDDEERTCGECLTSWSYETAEEAGIPLAA